MAAHIPTRIEVDPEQVDQVQVIAGCGRRIQPGRKDVQPIRQDLIQAQGREFPILDKQQAQVGNGLGRIKIGDRLRVAGVAAQLADEIIAVIPVPRDQPDRLVARNPDRAAGMGHPAKSRGVSSQPKIMEQAVF